jgi:uncharacterized membrane protein YwaF
LFLCIVIPPIYWFDTQFHANYMFLQLPSAGSPLMILSQWARGRHAVYLMLFAGIAFLVMLCMDLPFIKRYRR